MSIPRPGQTEILDLEQLPLTKQPRPDPLRVILMADALLLFAGFAVAALWTSHDWLRLPDTVVALASLAAFLRYWSARDF